MLFQYDQTMRRLGNDPELLNEFVQIFREDSPGLIDSMKQAVALGDQNGFRGKAHALKGLVSNFGAEEVVAFAADLEIAEFDAGSAETSSKVQRLDAMLKQLDEELASTVQR